MQKFGTHHHDEFIKSFNIKKNPSKLEMDFLEKTKKYLNFVKWIPGLRMVGIGNSISMNCASKQSDIDLFIVTTKNSMWFNRIMITFIFQVLGVRKTSRKHAGRFCLSFFCTLDGLDFSPWKLEQDIYLYFWILYFKPLLSYNDTYSLFLEKNSSWADFSEYYEIINNNKSFIKYKKNVAPSSGNREKVQNKWFVSFLDNLFKKIFLPKTLNSFNILGKPFGVVINDDLLKFHNKDIRKKIKKKLLVTT